MAASGSPPTIPTPVTLPSTARKTRRSVSNTALPIRDEFSPSQDNVEVVVPSTVTRAVRKKPSVAVLREESEPEDEKDKGVSKTGKFAEEVNKSRTKACLRSPRAFRPVPLSWLATSKAASRSCCKKTKMATGTVAISPTLTLSSQEARRVQEWALQKE